MKHFPAVLALAGVLAVFLFLARDSASSSPYDYDEADYMYVAGRGFVANYLDSPTQSVLEFARVGLGRGRDTGSRGFLSEYIRNSGDIDFYRHWHGPLLAYWLMAISPFAQDERLTRILGLIFPMLGIAIVYAGTVRLFASIPMAVMAAAMYGWSHAVARTTDLAPHQIFAVCTLAALIAAGCVAKTGDRRYWYASVVCAALAFCTLEVSFVLIAVLLIFAWQERVCLQLDWRLAVRTILLFLGTVLLVHPASILKLSFVKAYAFMLYLAVFRKGAWGGVTIGETWRLRFENAPFEWLLIVLAIVLYFVDRQSPTRRYSRALLHFSILMILVTFTVLTSEPRYLLPFLPVLAVFAAWTIGSWTERWTPRRSALAATLVCALMFTNTNLYAARHRVTTNLRAIRMLTEIRERSLDRSTLILSQQELPTVHYYNPQAKLKSYTDADSFRALVTSAEADAIIYPDLRIEPAGFKN
jgi:Dolichyl-phosphate-mannose-protein mannosyltransferase